jgi:hypothetical protein
LHKHRGAVLRVARATVSQPIVIKDWPKVGVAAIGVLLSTCPGHCVGRGKRHLCD